MNTKLTPPKKRTTFRKVLNLDRAQSVVISDPDMNATFHRDSKIVPIGKAYQIDDVVEFD